MKIKKLARNIFDDILAHGGKVYIVGGSVRDMIMKIHNEHDIDVEVFHLDYQELYDILSKWGHVNTFGKSFAIMQVDCLKGYDFALPRKERKTGDKHTDFTVEINKDLPLEKAILRRDLTMNALMYDYENNQVIDLCYGMNDIYDKVIRCVNPRTFIEDPLRILRIAQFIARFEMTVEDETKTLCQQMVEDGMLEHLSSERIYQEYCKILMANKPSLGFEFLKEINALPFYLEVLIHTHQREDYHPEGNVFNHTMLVLDIAALMKHKTSDPLSFMWSCLLHDIGKPEVTTPEGKAPLHNEAGVKLFKTIDLIQSNQQRKYIESMIMYHMHLMNMARNNARDSRWLKLLKKIDGKIPLDDLIYISQCDKLGRGKVAYETYDLFESYVKDKIERLGKEALQPIVTGEDLIEHEFKYPVLYKTILNEAYDLQISGMKKEKILRSLKKKYEQG